MILVCENVIFKLFWSHNLLEQSGRLIHTWRSFCKHTWKGNENVLFSLHHQVILTCDPSFLHCLCTYTITVVLRLNVMWTSGSSHFLITLWKKIVTIINNPISAVSGFPFSLSRSPDTLSTMWFMFTLLSSTTWTLLVLVVSLLLLWVEPVSLWTRWILPSLVVTRISLLQMGNVAVQDI